MVGSKNSRRRGDHRGRNPYKATHTKYDSFNTRLEKNYLNMKKTYYISPEIMHYYGVPSYSPEQNLLAAIMFRAYIDVELWRKLEKWELDHEKEQRKGYKRSNGRYSERSLRAQQGLRQTLASHHLDAIDWFLGTGVHENQRDVLSVTHICTELGLDYEEVKERVSIELRKKEGVLASDREPRPQKPQGMLIT